MFRAHQRPTPKEEGPLKKKLRLQGVPPQHVATATSAAASGPVAAAAPTRSAAGFAGPAAVASTATATSAAASGPVAPAAPAAVASTANATSAAASGPVAVAAPTRSLDEAGEDGFDHSAQVHARLCLDPPAAPNSAPNSALPPRLTTCMQHVMPSHTFHGVDTVVCALVRGSFAAVPGAVECK